MPSTLSTYFISYHMAIIYSVWFCWTTKRMTTKLKKGTHTKIQYHNPMRWNNSYCSLHVSNSSPTITIPLTNSSKFISFPSFFHPIQLELLFSLFCCFFFILVLTAHIHSYMVQKWCIFIVKRIVQWTIVLYEILSNIGKLHSGANDLCVFYM